MTDEEIEIIANKELDDEEVKEKITKFKLYKKITPEQREVYNQINLGLKKLGQQELEETQLHAANTMPNSFFPKVFNPFKEGRVEIDEASKTLKYKLLCPIMSANAVRMEYVTLKEITVADIIFSLEKYIKNPNQILEQIANLKMSLKLEDIAFKQLKGRDMERLLQLYTVFFVE